MSAITDPAFPFAPNWANGYRVSYEFKTDIFTSRSGAEQRRAWRQTPRKQLQFSMWEPTSGALNRFVYRNQHLEIALPDLSRHAEITQVTSDTFTVDPVPSWIAPGETIVGDTTRSVVDTVTGNTVTLLQPLPDAVTLIHPVVTGRLDDQIAVRNVTDSVIQADITVQLTPGALRPDDFGSPEEVFNRREVFLFDPNWSTPIAGQFSHTTDTVDFFRGRTQVYAPIQFGTRIRQFEIQYPTQADREAGVAFFSRMLGQRGEFYIPTWENDLPVARPAAAGETEVWIGGTDTYQTYADNTVHRAIAIRTQNGRQFYRRIVAITTDDTDTMLETDIGWPVALDDSVRLSWLLATRFATDQMELECLTDEVGRAQFSTRTLEDLPVSDADSVWPDLSEGAQWLLDTFGWVFTQNVICQPFDRWVNVTYPAIGETFRATDGGYYFRRKYGFPLGLYGIVDPLVTFVNVTYPAIAPYTLSDGTTADSTGITVDTVTITADRS